MKNLAKRIISTSMCAIAALSLTAHAKVGDIAGYAKYTDIAAYINHYPITSYNINDYTAVIAEDLQNYGFDVVWNGDDRSLSITKNYNATEITPYGTIYKYSSKAGQNSFPYLETDITTYVNGSKVESFNINGKTCVYIDSLAPYGEVVWVPEIRSIKLWIDGLPAQDYTPIEEVPMTTMYATDGRTILVENSEVEAYKNVGWYASQAEASAAQKASDPRYANTIKILEECKRNITLSAAAAETLSPAVDLYKMNPTKYAKYLVDMQNTINNIDSWLTKIRNLTENDRYLYPVYSSAKIDYVVVNSSNLAKVKTYATMVKYLKAAFDSSCKYYGVNP